MIAFCFFLIRFLPGHVSSDLFDRVIEGVIVWADHYLCQDGGYRLIDAAVDQLRADAVLQVVPNIALAHGGTDGHGSRGVAFMLPGKFVHGSVNHSDLGSIAVH